MVGVFGEPAGHGAVHHADPVGAQPALQLCRARPCVMQGQQFGAVAVETGAGIALLADQGGLLAQGGQLGVGVKIHFTALGCKNTQHSKIRALRRVSLPIRPCSPVCVWRARTDLASFHVPDSVRVRHWDLAVPVRTRAGLPIWLLGFSALPDGAGLGSVTCIRCIRVTLECDGLICHVSITRKCVH